MMFSALSITSFAAEPIDAQTEEIAAEFEALAVEEEERASLTWSGNTVTWYVTQTEIKNPNGSFTIYITYNLNNGGTILSDVPVIVWGLTGSYSVPGTIQYARAFFN